jgi:hypothetical protein
MVEETMESRAVDAAKLRVKREDLLAAFDVHEGLLNKARRDGADAKTRRAAWSAYNTIYLDLADVELELRISEFDELCQRAQSATSLPELGDLRRDIESYVARFKETKSQIVYSGAEQFTESLLPVIEIVDDGIRQVRDGVRTQLKDRPRAFSRTSGSTCIRRYGASRAIRTGPTRSRRGTRTTSCSSRGSPRSDDPEPPDLHVARRGGCFGLLGGRR